MAIPGTILLIVPIPSVALGVLLVLYHLTPLLRLLSNPTPILASLSKLIPHPRRNLPREFFNLPPRPSDEDSSKLTAGAALGIRGKLMLLLGAYGLVSMGCGWVYLLSSHLPAFALAISVLLLPNTVFWLAVYTNSQYSSLTSSNYASTRLDRVRESIVGNGGITHTTLPWIAAYSALPTLVLSGICAAVPSFAGVVLLVSTNICICATMAISLRARYRYHEVKKGMIRLASPCPSPLPPSLCSGDQEGKLSPAATEDDMRGLRDEVDWLSSPGDAPTVVSPFSYATSHTNPSHPSLSDLRSKSRSTTVNGSPTSWLTSPTSTPATIPKWDYSPSVSSPGPAPTQIFPRSPSPSPTASSGLPRPASRCALTAKASLTTLGLSTPGSAIRGADGSVLGAYSPNPFDPLPRNFESLTSYPISLDHLESRVTLATHALGSMESFAFSPANRGPSASRAVSSTWTLESYHSAMDEFKTPVRAGTNSRAAPPPPLPDMPLPPTPSAGRSETLFDWPVGKESTELLMVDREREKDWVEVDGYVDGSEGWGKGGRGVGVVALLGVVICYVLAVPILILGAKDSSTILYLISQLLPSPILALTSYLVRYRPGPTALPVTSARSAKSSTTSHHVSLALRSESQLSLPISISPKLTPPTQRPATAVDARFGRRLLEPKPSISNFGWTRASPNRRHTIYGVPTESRDMAAEAAMRRTMARQSAEVWISEGHAKTGDNIFARAAEMIKPVPALRVLDGPLSAPLRPHGMKEDQEGVMKKLRGGVMSMIPARWSSQFQSGPIEMGQFDDADAAARISTELVTVSKSPIAIQITSPSKFDARRVSGVSTYEGEGDTEGNLEVVGLGEVKMAQKGRMSASPTFVFAGPRSPTSPVEEGYELNWVTAGVLPGLVPTIKIGNDIRVRPNFTAVVDPETTPKKAPTALHSRAESLGGTPRGHGRSTSIDYSDASSSPVKSSMRNRKSPSKNKRHSSNLSLPAIPPQDFDDVRRSFESTGRDDHGVDLPPFPVIDFSRARDLSMVDEGDESQVTTISQMAALYREAEMTLNTPRQRLHSGATTLHLTPYTRSVATEALEAEALLKTPSTGRTCLTRAYDDTPEITPAMMDSFRANLATRTPASNNMRSHRNVSISDEVGMNSMCSEDQAMADEMEQVLLMDSPTRAEFVISPPLSGRPGSAVSEPSLKPKSSSASAASWAAATEHLSEVERNTFGFIPRKPSASTLASGYTSWGDDEDFGARDHATMAPAAPPLPPIPALTKVPSQTFKFPVNLPPSIVTSYPYPARSASVMDEHRPMQPHPSLQNLLCKKSVETVSSISDFEPHSPPAWEPSKKEMAMVKALKESATVTTNTTAEKQQGEGRKGLKELKLVNSEATKRNSRLLATQDKRESRISEKDKKYGLPKPSMTGQGGALSPGKVSRGSGKENAAVSGQGKRSKASAGSGPSGLRA